MSVKRICALILAVVLVCVLLPRSGVFAAEDASGFSGRRTVEFLADGSDLDNFVDGGRSMLDLRLRMNAPDWLAVSVRARGQDVVITLEIPFASGEEYALRLSQLLLAQPGIMYTDQAGMVLIEDFQPTGLLNWIQKILDENNTGAQLPLEEILTVSAQRMELNGTAYDPGTGAVYIVPEQKLDIEIQSLEVITAESDKGILTRTIEITSAVEWNEDWTLMEDRFEEIGEEAFADLKREGRKMRLRFSAYSQQELMNKTMYCLGFPVLLTESVTSSGNKTQNVIRSELYVLDGLMAEDGSFSFVYDCPKYYRNIEPISIYCDVSENRVTSSGGNLIQFGYECGFRFAQVQVVTDYSSLLGRVEKRIILTSPTAVAAQFHEYIRRTLESRLVNGVTLDIYDQDGIRFYELSYRSWFAEDMAEFTGATLSKSCQTGIQDSWLPFGKSILSDRIGTERLLSGSIPAQNVSLRYILPIWTRVVQKDQDRPVTVENGAVTVAVAEGDEIQVVYRRVHPLKTGLELCGLILVLILVLIVIRRIRKLRSRDGRGKKPVRVKKKNSSVEPAKRREAPKEKPVPEVKTVVRFCPNCGTACEPGGRFCKECGTDLSRSEKQ